LEGSNDWWQKIKKIDVLFVLHHGHELKKPFTTDCKNHLLAAIEAIKINSDLRVFFVGGNSPQKNVKAGSEQMKKWFLVEIQKRRLKCEKVHALSNSNNTAGNIKEIDMYLLFHGFKCGILSSDYHLKRIKKHLKWLDLKADCFSAERIIMETGDKAVVERIKGHMNSGYYKKEKMKEKIFTLYFTIDRKGKLATIYRKIKRKRE